MTLLQTAQFKKDLKRYRHRQEAMEALFDVLRHLQSNGRAPARCSPHRLKGQFSGCMECHVRSDLLLVVEIRINFLHTAKIKKSRERFKDGKEIHRYPSSK